MDRLGSDRVGQEEVDVALGSFSASLAPQRQRRKLDGSVGDSASLQILVYQSIITNTSISCDDYADVFISPIYTAFYAQYTLYTNSIVEFLNAD